MSFGGWMPPEEQPQGTEVAATGDHGQRAAYAMRPLTLGEILDRSFAVYRANFWLFVGIAFLSAAVQLVSQAVVLTMTRGFIPVARRQAHAAPTTFHFHLVGSQIGNWIGSLLFFLAAAVTQAATVWALSEVYLGRRTTIGDSIRAVIGRWLRFVGIGLWQAWSLLWLPLLLIVPGIVLLALVPRRGIAAGFGGGVLIFLAVTGGMAFGIIAFLRNSLAVQSAVVEGLKVRAAMRRSKVLAAGAKGRIFVVYLIGWCLFMVAGVLEMPLLMIIGFGALKGERHVLLQVVLLLVNFVAHSMVTPVLMIGLSLVYFDQRVRQEALDLLLMLGGRPAAGPEPEAGTSLKARTDEPAGDAATL
ncbi:MAG TPA: hypothetical protein VMD97_03660 [Candidatus Aquilonibacter sp.]|nr:hypothetical protein [Candidatus Aquilonibacter sp.]